MRQVVLLALVACCGCTAVLGLDERGRAEGEAGIADTDVADASTDTATPPDTFMPMDTFVAMDTAMPPDASAPCPFFGLSCSGDKTCVVTQTGSTYSVACETSPPIAPGGACTFFGKCAAGYGCRPNYSAAGATTKCV